jgi:hypothetical protein
MGGDFFFFSDAKKKMALNVYLPGGDFVYEKVAIYYVCIEVCIHPAWYM